MEDNPYEIVATRPTQESLVFVRVSAYDGQLPRAIDRWLQDREVDVGDLAGVGERAIPTALVDEVIAHLKHNCVRWDVYDRAVPQRKLSRAVADEAKKRERLAWSGAVRSIEAGLLAELHGLIDRLARRLVDGESFQASTVERLRAFLDLLPARNVTGHAGISDLASRAKALMDGVDAPSIRASEDVRQRLRDGLARLAHKSAAHAVGF